MLDPKIQAISTELIQIYIKLNQRAPNFMQAFFKIVYHKKKKQVEEYEQSLTYKQRQSLFPWSYKITKPLPSPICSKRINDYVYICLDCRQCNGAIVCYECFSQGNHEGHRYIQKESHTSICDCGDQDVWNKKGFCKRHGNSDEIVQIEENIRIHFISQMKLAFYLYFWLVDQTKQDGSLKSLKHQYGTLFSERTANLVSKEYQLKYLLNQVLQSKFDEFPSLIEKDLTILERYFRMKDWGQLSSFCDIATELFPVKQFQHSFLKQFFIKTFKNEMLQRYPLRYLDFQFMVRAKTMSQLLQKKKINPFMLDPSKPIDNIRLAQNIFKTYFNNLQYLLGMKSSFQYFCLHFSNINICDMLFYRRYTQYSENQKYIIYLDQYFLKLYGEILKIILSQRSVLLKIIGQLSQFIKKNKNQSYSLVHQRAFAMTVTAYLQGDLNTLKRQETRNSLLFQIGFSQNQEKDINQFVGQQINNYLFRKSKADQYQIHWEEHFKNIKKGEIKSQQKIFLLQSLDYTYIKILSKLYIGNISFQKHIETVLKRLLRQQKKESSLSLMRFIYCVFSIQIDEQIVNDQIGIIHKQPIFTFLKKLLKSCPTPNVIQFKKMAGYFFNNQKLVQDFLTSEVKVEKGRIIHNFQQKPLQLLIYRGFLWDKLKLLKPDILFFSQLTSLSFKNQSKMYNQQIYSILFTHVYIIEQSKLYNKHQLKLYANIKEQCIMQLTVLYSISKDSRAQRLLQEMLINLKQMPLLISKSVIDQAKLILHPLAGEKEANQLKIKDQEDKKRQILLKKRKQKQQIMKKKQTQLLKNYQKSQQNQSIQTCIYCKQNSNIPLYFVAYCNLTNLYEKRCLEIADQHLYFDTCGHQIHQQCYNKYLSQVQQLNVCFLCKRQVNILVPIIDKQRIAKTEDFTNIIYPTLFRLYIDDEELIEQFFTIKHRQNIISVLLQSFVREIIVKGLYASKYFAKETLPIYSYIYNILKLQSKQQLLKIIQRMIKQIQQFKLKPPQKELQIFLLNLLGKNICKTQSNYKNSLDKHLSSYFYKIIQLFDNKSQENAFSHFQLHNQQTLVNELPQKMIELLPPKPICKLCNKLTNRLLSCMLCQWIGCNDDHNCMNMHAQKQHLGKSVFIYLINGQLINVDKGRLYQKQSIYYNFFRQSPTISVSFDKEKLSKFQLDKNEYQALRKNIIYYRTSS